MCACIMDQNLDIDDMMEVDDDQEQRIQLEMMCLYRQQMEQRQKRVVMTETPLTLEDLSIICVEENISYFSNIERPFHGLPGALLEKLSPLFSSRLDILPLFVTPQTLTLEIDEMRDSDIDQMMQFLRSVSSTCKRLKTFSYFGCEENLNGIHMKPREMEEFLSTLTKLQRLSLHNCGVDDAMLATIARTSHDTLCYLDICGLKTVSDIGLTAVTSCKNLVYLYFGSDYFSNEAICNALSKLPELAAFYNHNDNQIINQVYAMHGGRVKLKLEEIAIDDDINLENIFNILPCVKFVSVKKMAALISLQNCKLSNVSGLHIYQEPNEYLGELSSTIVNSLEQVIKNVSTNLTWLTIANTGIPSFDVSIIGYHCINLIFVNIDVKVEECKYDLDDGHFSNLRAFDFDPEMNMTIRQLVKFNQKLLFHILSRPSLSFARVHHVLETNTLLKLIKETRHNENVFNKITEFDIKGTELSIDVILNFVCVAPKLETLNLRNCVRSSRDMELLELFMSKEFGSVQFQKNSDVTDVCCVCHAFYP